MDPMERAHVAMSMALACARLNPEATVAVPCLTAAVYEVIDEAIEVMAVEIEDAERLHVVFAH